MTKQIETLTAFYSTKYHVPITMLTSAWQVQDWNRRGIAIVLPNSADDAREVGKILIGDLVVVEETPVARLGTNWLVMFMWHLQEHRFELAQMLIDKHLPKMCRAFRNRQRESLIDTMQTVAAERKHELAVSLRDDRYELERLCMQVMTLSRKIECDGEILNMFSKAPEFIKAKATRTFVEMMRLVPSCYSHINVVEKSVFAETYPITLEHDGGSYQFEPYVVEIDLDKGKVLISGGTEMNGYVHPHVTDDPNNICWGNIGHLVSRLTGECDIHGLLQLVHQFLNSYNSSDPFQKIEKWDPDWQDDTEDDDPYCSWCDDYGHDISDCESCWWCEHCQQYDDHDADECPNHPKDEEEEEEDADAELAEDTATAG